MKKAEEHIPLISPNDLPDNNSLASLDEASSLLLNTEFSEQVVSADDAVMRESEDTSPISPNDLPDNNSLASLDEASSLLLNAVDTTPISNGKQVRQTRHRRNRMKVNSWQTSETPPTIELKRNVSSGDSMREANKKFHAFLIYSRESDCKTIIRELEEGLGKKELKWCNYEDDFSPGVSILYNIEIFLFSSKRVVIFLSPEFYENKLLTYIMETAVMYCVDHGRAGIISVLSNSNFSQIPLYLREFPYVDTLNQGWTNTLLRMLCDKVKPLNIPDNNISINCETFGTMRSINSDPPTLRIKLSEITKTQIKIWHKRHFGKLEAEQNGNTSSEQAQQSHCEDFPELPTERGVDAELMFACMLRQQNEKVYECSETIINEEFSVAEGDVLQVCEMTIDASHVTVKNSRGEVGNIRKNQLTPSLFAIPNAGFKITKQPISVNENSDYKQELKILGLQVYQATDSTSMNTQYVGVKSGDIVCILSEKGKLARVKNCRNDIGYIDKRLLKKL